MNLSIDERLKFAKQAATVFLLTDIATVIVELIFAYREQVWQLYLLATIAVLQAICLGVSLWLYKRDRLLFGYRIVTISLFMHTIILSLVIANIALVLGMGLVLSTFLTASRVVSEANERNGECEKRFHRLFIAWRRGDNESGHRDSTRTDSHEY